MTVPLAKCCRARLPASMLSRLGPLRAQTELRAAVCGEHLWLCWPEGASDILDALLPLDGIDLFGQRDGRWYRPGQHLPAFEVPTEMETASLASILFPAPFEAVPPGGTALARQPIRLVGCDRVRPCTLMRTTMSDLAAWADHATTYQLSVISAVHAGPIVLLRGTRLPNLNGERFWGRRLFFPLGQRPEPDLAEDVLAAALRLEAGDIALVSDDGAELIPSAVFQPLTRAGVRLALREVSS